MEIPKLLMALIGLPNSSGSNQNITLEKNKTIIVTKRTVRFSYNVYQTHNITSFTEGEVKIPGIPWGIIGICFVASLIIGANNGDRLILIILAPVLFFGSIVGTVRNLINLKHYGLLLTLNSGDRTLFTTKEKKALKQVIGVIYDFIETEKEATYEIFISNSEVRGNFIQGNVEGNASYLSSDSEHDTKSKR
ncbi:DUF6232 family protein [Microcoleus sp. CAWBG58]|uniref:DUF6232 family protein n=1 Tax=Microcoleus sp. CAWBG58 TaxID=2841651 RepID=UPI0025E3BCAF|nr:DUF6232 family protein [Microcoleus sp. CAWBG58]